MLSKEHLQHIALIAQLKAMWEIEEAREIVRTLSDKGGYFGSYIPAIFASAAVYMEKNHISVYDIEY